MLVRRQALLARRSLQRACRGFVPEHGAEPGHRLLVRSSCGPSRRAPIRVVALNPRLLVEGRQVTAHHPVTEDTATRYVRERVLTGLETLRDFERFAEAPAAQSRARTGR